MKIKSITLQNYKQFVEPKTISFCNPKGKINNKMLLVGKNGAGKTTVLQAIVMLVASATREGFTPESLDWEGFQYQHLQTGEKELCAEACIVFEEDERQATIEYAKDNNLNVMPNSKQEVMLKLDYFNKFIYTSLKKKADFFQFRGHQYAQMLSKRTPDKRKLFERVGNIYLTGKKIEMKEGMFDFYEKIESLYKAVFPNRSFLGSVPNFDIYEKAKAPYFFLFDGRNKYELAEMSAGERAIFPILMDFARWNINNSIIIIDEIELHLHPPLQQGFISVLEKLGKNNQFILTTHSDDVAYMFDKSEIIRF
ncbi:MAG: ATP-binding cassette domain-containing protein [Bacteroidetes bacterium]|nr:MAG: ATP-binding cassette domain-containing protein [Bacteroidota bacterium]